MLLKEQRKFYLSAAIFDLDGTVLNNEEEYGKAFRKVLKTLGVSINVKYPHISGIGIKKNWEFLIEKFSIKTARSLDDLVRATQEIYADELPMVKMQKGLAAFIEDLRNNEIELALATSNDAQIVEKVNYKFNFKRFFAVITTKEEVCHLKPAPDLFLKAAEELRAMPEECLVFEDSQAGIEAAYRAGMKAIGIASDPQRGEDLHGADLIISNYEGLTLKKLLIDMSR